MRIPNRLKKPWKAVLLLSPIALAATPAAVDFEKEIQPIFAAKCLSCHGAAKQKSGYRLDVKERALRGGEAHAPNIVPGSSAKSPLLQLVGGQGEPKMPPTGEPLSAEQIALLRRWIDEGAV